MACCLSHYLLYVMTFYKGASIQELNVKQGKKLLFRESLKGGWGWVRGWLSTNLISPPKICPDSSDSNFASNHIFWRQKGEAKAHSQ